MLKKIHFAVLAVMLMIGLFTTPAFCSAGIAPDKQKHIGVAAGANLAMEAMGVKKTTRYCILGGLFVAKEVYDHNKEHSTHDHWGDLAADVGGVIISDGVIWIVHRTF